MRLKGILAILGLATALVGWTAAAVAQEGSDPSDPAEPQAAEPAAPEKRPRYFGLYVRALTGAADTGDFNTSIETISTKLSETRFEFADNTFAQVGVGWRFADGKGDLRLSLNGYKEDGYTLDSEGRANGIIGGSGGVVQDPLIWWRTRIENGVLTTQLTPPMWDLADDANDNGIIEQSEVRYGMPSFTLTQPVTDDLQNRQQHVDLVYGREFGGRRYSGRWWSGMRYFTYEGNQLATAYVSIGPADVGFTDGFNNPLLLFRQETSGVGPTGSMEAHFNFFSKRLQFYLKGEAAFMLLDLETDTGPFVTIVQSEIQPTVLIPVPARFNESREKSSWQTGAEVGMRIMLNSGLHFEAGYNVTGYLDSVLMPPKIQVPENLQEANVQPPSAVYVTQDIVHDGWRAGIAFQF